MNTVQQIKLIQKTTGDIHLISTNNIKGKVKVGLNVYVHPESKYLHTHTYQYSPNSKKIGKIIKVYGLIESNRRRYYAYKYCRANMVERLLMCLPDLWVRYCEVEIV